MNKILQTIMESLKSTRDEYDIQWDRYIGESYEDCELFWDNLKDNLLQSQIKLIEAVIVGIKQALIREPHTVTGEGYNRALKEQIYSLNETLEFLKKSL